MRFYLLIMIFFATIRAEDTTDYDKIFDKIEQKETHFDKSKRSFQKKELIINEEYRAGLKKTLGIYSKNLTLLQKEVTKEGDLEGVLAVKAEIERFSKEQTVLEVSDGAAFYKATKTYFKFAKIKTKKRNKKLEKAIDSYVKKLKKVQKELVQQSKIEEALVVDKEIKRVKAIDTNSYAYQGERKKEEHRQEKQKELLKFDLKSFLESNEFETFNTFKASVPLEDRKKVILTFKDGVEYLNGKKGQYSYKILDSNSLKRLHPWAANFILTLSKDKKSFSAKKQGAGVTPKFMWLKDEK